MMIYKELAEIEGSNRAAAICTIIRSRGSVPRHALSKMIVYPDGTISGTIGGGELENRVITEALLVIRDGRAKLLEYNMADPERGDPGVCGGQVEVFVEPIQPKATLLVIGAGHVGQAVVHLGGWLGFWVVVSDDRPGFCTPEKVPEAHEYYPVQITKLVEQFKITSWTYVVLTTRGIDVDIQGLPSLLESSPAYIGVIGSRRRWETTKEKLLEMGVSKENINRVRSPIGLELNAETPEEIAVSIMAEILMLRNGGDGSFMMENK
jgi:xanthine dehydrogenase accessory factor